MENKMTAEKRKPKFWIGFNSFADFGVTVEASIIISPEYNITGITEMQHSPDSARAITLIFNRRKQKLGRRGYSLKQEWEQTGSDTTRVAEHVGRPAGTTELPDGVLEIIEDQVARVAKDNTDYEKLLANIKYRVEALMREKGLVIVRRDQKYEEMKHGE